MAASRSRPDVSHFEFEPTFDYNLLHWKGSLNGVGNRFRLIADQYRSKVRTAARKELSSYKARMNNVSNRYSNTVPQSIHGESHGLPVSAVMLNWFMPLRNMEPPTTGLVLPPGMRPGHKSNTVARTWLSTLTATHCTIRL